MTRVILATIFIVGINIGILLIAKWLGRRLKSKWQGWSYGLAEVLRVGILFTAVHLLWRFNHNAYEAVALIFCAAIGQLIIQVALHLKGII